MFPGSAVIGLLCAAVQSISVNGGQAVSPKSATGRAGFTLVSEAESGVGFTNALEEAHGLANVNLMNGSGVALGDYDGDGLCDIYFCGLSNDNRLFKNLGNWRFRDVTAESGVQCAGQNATGAVFADVNGDGRLDLVVSSLGGPNACFINQGNGRFVDTIATSGLSSRLGGMSMAFGDVDGNGTLDLYLANYGVTSILRSGGALNLSYVNGKPVVRGRYAQRIKIVDGLMFELGEPDALYLNDGKGVFRQVGWTSGAFLDESGKPVREVPWDQGLSVMFYDVNDDRAPDIYVCNDAFTPDRFWINDGKGRFRAMDHLSWRTTSHFAMGVDFGDLNRDGALDFFVVDMLSREHRYIVTQKSQMPPQPRPPGRIEAQMQMRRNTLYEGLGDGTYREVANYAGAAASEWSWSCVFIDVDLDGWEDVLVSNGFPFNMDDLDAKQRIRAMGQMNVEQSRRSLLTIPPLITQNVAFRNLGNMRFEEIGAQWGFSATNISNGFACADLDNDGDLDVVVNCLNAPALVYRNESPAARVGVRLKGKAPNTQGIGAKIVVEGGPVRQVQEVICGGRYVSGDDPMRVFACGSETNRLRIEVTWRSGAVSVLENTEPNHIYVIDESSARPAAKKEVPLTASLFEDASAKLGHQHHERDFNDYEIQPSLPNKLSQSGPPVLSTDFNGDGWRDLVIGTGAGGKIAVYRNRGGTFEAVPQTLTMPEDVVALAIAGRELIVGLQHLEAPLQSSIELLEISADGVLTRKGILSGVTASIGTLAVKGDRLFAGGRFVRGRYPEPAPSYVFERKGGDWELKETLPQFGSVTAAVWIGEELVVASEWGGIRILDSSFVAREVNSGVGRWLSLGTGDFDGDGRIDLVAGNWGENSLYAQAPDRQVHLYWCDFSQAGRVDIVEAYEGPGGRIVPWRNMDQLSAALPGVRQQFPTHAAYASASVDQILGQRQRTHVRTGTLSSMVFLNRGDRFEAVKLPREAQLSPVFGIAVADFTGDGKLDLFLAENFFAAREEDGPLDAGRGLLLEGQGNGRFRAIDGSRSGLKVYGEQRGCLADDFNNDGAADLIVTQNGAATKLFQRVR